MKIFGRFIVVQLVLGISWSNTILYRCRPKTPQINKEIHSNQEDAHGFNQHSVTKEQPQDIKFGLRSSFGLIGSNNKLTGLSLSDDKTDASKSNISRDRNFISLSVDNQSVPSSQVNTPQRSGPLKNTENKPLFKSTLPNVKKTIPATEITPHQLVHEKSTVNKDFIKPNIDNLIPKTETIPHLPAPLTLSTKKVSLERADPENPFFTRQDKKNFLNATRPKQVIKGTENDYLIKYIKDELKISDCLTNSTDEKYFDYKLCSHHDLTTFDLNQTLIINKVNKLRQSYFLEDNIPRNNLIKDPKLIPASQKHSDHMARCLNHDHQVFPYLDFNRRKRILESQYRKAYYSENVGWWCYNNHRGMKNDQAQIDYESEQLFIEWEKSPDHLENMINPIFQKIAIARRGAFWTMTLSN